MSVITYQLIRRNIAREIILLAKNLVEYFWPLAPKFAGSNPAEAFGFFGRKNPQHTFHRRGSKRICPMSQLCGMLKNLVIYLN